MILWRKEETEEQEDKAQEEETEQTPDEERDHILPWDRERVI